MVMFTPAFTDSTQFGCYLFFALTNFLFIPTVYIFYPETKGRNLEEIDIIFAKGFSEGINYPKAEKALPHLTEGEVQAHAEKEGFSSSDDEEARFGEKREVDQKM